MVSGSFLTVISVVKVQVEHCGNLKATKLDEKIEYRLFFLQSVPEEGEISGF